MKHPSAIFASKYSWYDIAISGRCTSYAASKYSLAGPFFS